MSEDDFFTKVWKSLFNRRSGESEQKQLPVNEPIIRQEDFIFECNQFRKSRKFREALDHLYSLTREKLGGESENQELHVHQSQYGNGFYFNFYDKYSVREFECLFEYFKDRILTQPYKIYNSERRFKEMPDHVQKRERHYLKPDVNSIKDRPVDQYFGNINIELFWNNNQPAYIKIMANIYQDSRYKPALPFENFIDFIFDRETSAN